ncbi:MAG: hypothetical protein Q8N55_02020 [bacterium]|nr:hypothetical protein [bacterium]
MKTNLVILIIALVAIVVVGGLYLYTQQPTTLEEGNEIGDENEEPVACPQDAMQCPDGSSVSRVAPDCEFAECPETSCIKEGNVGWNKDGAYCCTGLTKITTTAGGDNSCDSAGYTSGEIFTCTYCGNGVCGLGENKCNCPSDCTE